MRQSRRAGSRLPLAVAKSVCVAPEHVACWVPATRQTAGAGCTLLKQSNASTRGTSRVEWLAVQRTRGEISLCWNVASSLMMAGISLTALNMQPREMASSSPTSSPPTGDSSAAGSDQAIQEGDLVETQVHNQHKPPSPVVLVVSSSQSVVHQLQQSLPAYSRCLSAGTLQQALTVLRSDVASLDVLLLDMEGSASMALLEAVRVPETPCSSSPSRGLQWPVSWVRMQSRSAGV
ncbi:hypothetical protein HaLaN_25965 [Haematococcus lacustris]|uniref:Uncharacterized protein n=1 Tax=Haematococcus lacustris TaxID=44745 RepID=A0A6A0A566_HAELA|nr:hypothetical protein HaLaN_25965 [Haematococcus lacustris]